MNGSTLRALLLALLATAGAAAAPPAPRDASADAAERIIGGALAGNGAYEKLAELTDTIGPRLSGSPGAEAAVQWALRRFAEDGVSAHREKAMVAHWVRGVERAEVIASPGAAAVPLAVTALGGSVGTAEGGITAEVIEVRSFDELRALGAKARGKIVLFQHTMSTAAGYGQFAVFRHRGAAEAARVGAAAALVRSLATGSLRSPHTGTMEYAEGTPRIPAAAVATEDAELLHRLVARGPTRVHLVLGCGGQPDVESANVVAEVRGREHPEEVVVLGAHLDSWDLAQGAVDDGAGVVIAMETARLIARLPRAPRRTVRVVLFMNEENGLDGAKAYAKAHAAELPRHVAALEADGGAGRPLEVGLRAGDGAAQLLGPQLLPLSALGIGPLAEGGEGGADIGPLARAGVPIVSVRQDMTHYFDWHHSAADTLDKVVPHELAQSTAAFAWVSWSLAELPAALSRPPPSPARGEGAAKAPAPAPNAASSSPAEPAK